MYLRIPIEGVSETIDTPVTLDLIKSLFVNLETKPMHIDVENDYIGYKNKTWILGNTTTTDLFGPNQEFVAAKITTGNVDTTPASGIPFTNNTITLIEDEYAELIARPWGLDTEYQISMVYFTKSKTDADTLISRLRYLASASQTQFIARVGYYYFPNDTFYKVINGVLANKMALGSNPYTDEAEPLVTYLKDIVNNNGGTQFSWSNTLDLHRMKNYPVVRTDNLLIHYFITSDMFGAKKAYDDAKGYWGVPISIRAVMFRPEAIDLHCNGFAYNNHVLGITGTTGSSDIIHFPEYDTTHPICDYNCSTVASLLLQVNEGDLQEVVNLKELGYCKIEDKYIPYLTEHRDKIFSKDSPLLVKLIVNGTEAPTDVLTIDENLNIRTTIPLDPIERYHLIFCMVNYYEDLTLVGKRIYDDYDLFHTPEYIIVNLDGTFIIDKKHMTLKGVRDPNIYTDRLWITAVKD